MYYVPHEIATNYDSTVSKTQYNVGIICVSLGLLCVSLGQELFVRGFVRLPGCTNPANKDTLSSSGFEKLKGTKTIKKRKGEEEKSVPCLL